MPRKKGPTNGPPRKRPIERYEHTDKKRVNNPQVGLVTPETDPVAPSHKSYDYVAPVPSVKPKQELDYDPHLDPQLVWAGKKEHSSFEVPTVSLHVHERIDPYTIIKAVRKKNGNGVPAQPSLFERPEEHRPLREEIDFYQHAHGWSNRLIAGDSLLVMNSLLEKEGMAGQVQMVYFDPPYGIKYGSNFQPFVNKREVKDGKDEDLTQEPEMIRAFRDTWELGAHSYLSYLRDRLLLSSDLLHETGSCFVQISEENLHHVREVMDEIFGKTNFCGIIAFKKTTGLTSDLVPQVCDFLVWYAKDRKKVKYRQLYTEKNLAEEVRGEFKYLDTESGGFRTLTDSEKDNPGDIEVRKLFRTNSAVSPGVRANTTGSFEYRGMKFDSGPTRNWKTTIPGMVKLASIGRLMLVPGSTRIYKQYWTDFPYIPLTNTWLDVRSEQDRIYVVQTDDRVIARALLMTTDAGDLVLDPTCGSGTTAAVAERWGRRWITCDTSRVSVTVAKQRLMAASYDYFQLAHEEEGIGSGLRYKTLPHVMLSSIANNPDVREGMTRETLDAAIARYADQETIYDQPQVDRGKVRVSGPFTYEAVPAPTVRSLDDIDLGAPVAKPQESLADFRDAATPLLDASIARKGATLRHSEWRDELLKTGLRGKSGNQINFSRVEPLAGTRWLHADAETKGVKAERVVVSFGPEFSLLEQRQVELAWEEARTLSPKPAMIVFAAFEFDPEAAKDIDALTKEKTGMTFLTAQMNADLLTEDLKKKRASNQSFWLVGRPDVELRQIKSGEQKGKWQLEVNGFDYYNTRTGTIDSGDKSKIAMWLLDTDYDGRSLYPRQVFFPMTAEDEGWARLARNLKAEIDPELIEVYRGTVSLPFEAGKYIAVKVIDDRGIESLKVVEVK
jgi:adenine-specific DNA-methyltransferase